MRRILIASMIATVLSLVVSGCTRSSDCCDTCYRDRDCWEAREGYDCRHRHWHNKLIMPEEFFDTRDVRHDSLYGDYHGWRDRDCGRYYDDMKRDREKSRRWSRHQRDHRYRCPRRCDEDDLSERFLPHPAPHMEYDE